MIYYTFLLFLVFEYVRPGGYIPALNVLRLNTVLPLGALAATLLTSRGAPGTELVREFNTKLIVLLLMLIVLSILFADVTLYAYNIFVAVFGYALMYWVIARQIDDLRKLKGVFATLVLIHVTIALLTPQMFTDPDAR